MYVLLQYGLYASFVGGFVYAVMGTCPQINIGPTALLSLLTFTYTNGTSPDFTVLLCFASGIVQLIAGMLRLGMYSQNKITYKLFWQTEHRTSTNEMAG